MAALDFWIQFSARIARRPAPWIALHRILSAPLLLRLKRETVAIDGVRVAVQIRSRHLHHLLGDLEPAAPGPPDLEVVQVHPWTATLWRRRGWLTFPVFVRYRAPVSAVPPGRLSKSLRANLARAERSGFRARRGSGADWEMARAMVEDWARSRFRGDAWMPPEHAWHRMRRHGRLLVIGDGTRDVGVAIVLRGAGGREAWFTSLGIAGGGPELLRAGAVTAVYAAVAEDARTSGAQMLDSGRSYARVDDPIGAYKGRWGLRVGADPLSPVYAVRPCTRAGRLILERRPLFALGRGGALRERR
jgi:hypothetical protein